MHGQVVRNIIIKKMSVNHGVYNVEEIDAGYTESIKIAETPVIILPRFQSLVIIFPSVDNEFLARFPGGQRSSEFCILILVIPQVVSKRTTGTINYGHLPVFFIVGLAQAGNNCGQDNCLVGIMAFNNRFYGYSICFLCGHRANSQQTNTCTQNAGKNSPKVEQPV
jgi:hypothetical protein